MKARTFILLIVALLTTISTTPVPLAANSLEPLIQTPTTIRMLPGATQQIKVGPGNQTNPHVACNLASYTDDDFEGTSLIKYFDFATNTEQVVPGNGLAR